MTTAPAIIEEYRPYGGNRELFKMYARKTLPPELLLSGPAGTGKSRVALELINAANMDYPRARCLMLRETRRSLSESGMVTFEQKVLHPAQNVHFHSSKQQYQYPNGSILAVGGMDRSSKLMSSEWDIIYFMESIETTEDKWEAATVRLRNGVLPFQLMLGDTNPGPQSHWMLQRCNAGLTHMLETRHEDNPLYFNRDGTMTVAGARYLEKLDRLTGVRYARYRLGLWVSAEGMVYEDSWDRSRNVIDSFPIPKDWPRYLAIDFGYVHPFVCLWAARDPDGRLFVYRQIYMTKKLVEDHAKDILTVSGWFHMLPRDHPKYSNSPASWADPLPREIITDHDAEDRMTLERHLGLRTTAAHKGVSDGIQAVAARFRAQGDGKPRIAIFRDSLVETDRDLAEGKQPTCLQDEPESYVWDTRQGMKKGEQPVKESDHGLDALRYLCARFDLKPGDVTVFKHNIWR